MWPCRQQGAPASDGLNALRSVFIVCYTKVIFRAKQVPYTKTQIKYTRFLKEHLALAILVLIVQFAVFNNVKVSSVPGPCCD